jgi:coenzyme F420-reducing hydrogenase alpha subunit
VIGPLRAIDFINLVQRVVELFAKLFNSLKNFLFFFILQIQMLELVKKRSDDYWVDDQHHDHNNHESDPQKEKEFLAEDFYYFLKKVHYQDHGSHLDQVHFYLVL